MIINIKTEGIASNRIMQYFVFWEEKKKTEKSKNEKGPLEKNI